MIKISPTFKTCSDLQFKDLFFIILLLLGSGNVLSQENIQSRPVIEEMPDSLMQQRTDHYKDQLVTYLQEWIIDGYDTRAADAWHRDYSSLDAFQRSVEPNRNRWRSILKPPELMKTGPLVKTPHPYLKDINAEWVELPLGPVTAQAILVFPKNASNEKPVPLVIAQHGIGSYPESTFALNNDLYHAYARDLLKAGFAVLAPMNLRSIEYRNYVERLCRLIDTTLPGMRELRLPSIVD